eukprot:TRINITY_DN7640_c0_g1_i2.p1 TRINITY_DN7640_c0_g1~~TRINITY_DN7640_c0_g1_i2.p1  ORF type:complete len:191 (-),score=68.96 TRINITY_DN7640_c0_g1_i2:118-690(-)
MTGNEHSGLFMKKQAQDELHHPVLSQIEPHLAAKQMVSTPIAVWHVLKILNTMGSAEERARGEDILRRLLIVGPRDSVAREAQAQAAREGEHYDLEPELVVEVSPRVAALSSSRIVHARNKEVFGVADTLRIPTLTSNQRFVQTAAQAGVFVRAALHAPRALVTYELSEELARRYPPREAPDPSYACGVQ